MPEKAQCRKEFFGPCHFEWESKNAHPPSWASSFGQLMKYDRYREALFTPICWAQVQCNWQTYVMYMYLEPNWPLFLRVNLPRQGPNSNQNKGHWGSRYTIPASSRRDILIAQMEVRFSRPEVVFSGSKRGHDLKNLVSGSPLATIFLFPGWFFIFVGCKKILPFCQHFYNISWCAYIHISADWPIKAYIRA